MKIGMVLLLLMVLVTAYLIGAAIRRSIQTNRKQAWNTAVLNSRWEVFSDPDGSIIQIGVRRVARAGKRFEVLDQQITERVSCDLPKDERDMEVRIAKADARALADTLNED